MFWRIMNLAKEVEQLEGKPPQSRTCFGELGACGLTLLLLLNAYF
jgi:hypothetical protein